MFSRFGKNSSLQGFLATKGPTGGESSKAPAQDKETHVEAELVRRKRKMPSETEGETTAPAPHNSIMTTSKTMAASSSHPQTASEELFEPKFFFDKTHRLPISASFFAEKPIPCLGSTIVTNTILPKDRSAISKLSAHDRFNIMCDYFEKMKVAAVTQFETDMALSGHFRRENEDLKKELIK